MASIYKFEDLECWSIARSICREVYDISRSGPFASDFALKDQMRRAAISIMSNIAEGFHSGGNKEKVRFLRYARRSAAEVKCQLYAAFDQGYISESELKNFHHSLDICSGKISALVNYLQKSNRA